MTALINLVSSYFMCKVWKGVGCAIGTGGACIIATVILMNIVYDKKINIEIIDYWKNIGRQTLGMLPAFAVGALIMRFVTIDSITELLVYIAVYSIIFLVDIYFLSMNSYEKQLLNNTVIKVFKTVLNKA